MPLRSHITREELVQSLKYSLADSSFYFIMVGFGETFFSPFAIWLGANPIELGLLNTIPLLIGAFFQIFCSYFIKKFGSRQKFMVVTIALQALMFLPMMFVPHLPHPYGLFLLCVTLYQIFILIHVPAWNSWIVDLTHEATRGDYFGFQKRITQFVVFLSILFAGPLLKFLRNSFGNEYFAFVTLFAIAMVARLISGYFISLKVEPIIDFNKLEKIRFVDELKTLKDNHLGRLILFLAFMSFASYVCIPFFTPYMLTQLKWDYDRFALVASLVVMTRIFCSPAWGALCDKHGCRQMLLISSFGISLMPILWLFSDNLWYLCLVQIVSGLFWSGFELSWFNFMIDSTTQHNRTQFFTLQQILSNLAMVGGSLLGGVIIFYQGNQKIDYHEVFVVSTILRLILACTVIYFIREVRIVTDLRYRDFAPIFFKAVRDRGVFYLPEVLREEK